MNILLIVPEFPPNHVGGGGVVFQSLAKAYKLDGHEVLVISGDYTKKNILTSLQIKQENDTNILRLPEFFSPVSLLNTVMPYPFWYNFKLKKIIKEFKPDFIHIHGYGLFMPAQVAKIVNKLNLEYTFTIHGAPVSPEKMKNKLINFSYNFYHKFYGFPMLNKAKRITAVSNFAKDFDIFKNWRRSIDIVGNGINPDDYDLSINFNIFSNRGIKSDSNTKIILSLGRIEWIKGFEKIIELLPEIISKGYDVKYCIAGKDNGEKENLILLAKKLGVEDRLIFLGYLDGDEKNSILKFCDVVAIPSKSESYGIVALEARYFQKPVITTFAGGLKDSLQGYKLAFSINEWKSIFESKALQSNEIHKFYYSSIINNYIGLYENNKKNNSVL